MKLLYLSHIEQKKLRHRHLPALLISVLLVEFLWLAFVLRDPDASDLSHGYHMLLLSVPTLVTIFFPITLAMAASRLCDMEHKGETLKQLCTLESKSDIYLTKVLLGACYSLLLAAAQPLLIFALGKLFHFTQDFLAMQIGYLTLLIFLLNLIIFFIQLLLSLWLENQLIPMVVGLFGSFFGLFGLYLPNLRRFVVWGYYVLLTPVDMYWDADTRITSYFDKPCNWRALAVLAVFSVLLCLVGRYAFCKKED